MRRRPATDPDRLRQRLLAMFDPPPKSSVTVMNFAQEPTMPDRANVTYTHAHATITCDRYPDVDVEIDGGEVFLRQAGRIGRRKDLVLLDREAAAALVDVITREQSMP